VHAALNSEPEKDYKNEHNRTGKGRKGKILGC